MNRRRVGAAAVLLAVVLGGCSLAGTWKTVQIAPQGAAFPIDQATFDDSGRYTASREEDGVVRTETGRYTWNGMRLELRPADGEPKRFRGRASGSRLRLTHSTDDVQVRATLERIEN